MAEFLIGVPTFNGFRRVELLLQNLRQRTPNDIDHVIVVCDDSGRQDHRSKVLPLCQKWNAQYIQNPQNKGVAASWNALVRSFDCKYAILLNDDVFVDKDWLRPVAYALRSNPRVGAFSLNCHFITEHDVPSLLAGPDATVVPLNVRWQDGRLIRDERFMSMPVPHDGAPGRVMCPGGMAFGFRKEMYDMVGGFDERYFAFYEESIPGNEFVLVRDEKRGTRLMKIEDLYRESSESKDFPDERRVVRPSGLECLSATVRKDPDVAFLTIRENDVMSLDKASTSTLISVKKRAVSKLEKATRVDGAWAPVTGIVRHRRRNKILHIRQKNGSVFVTENHSMVLPEGGGFRIVEPRAFASEALPQASMVPLPESGTLVDLGSLVNGWNQYRQDDSAMWYLGKLNGVPSEKRVSPRVPRWLDLSSKDGEDFCWFLGFYVAEGSTSVVTENYGQYIINLACGADRRLVERAEDIWRRVVGTKTSITTSTSKRYLERGLKQIYRLNTFHKLIGVLLVEMCGKGSRNKRIPDFIYDAPRACKKAFLSGYVAGDGLEIAPKSERDESRPTIHVETVSRALAAGLSILLSSLGKRFSLQYRPKYESYAIRTINQFVGHRDTKVVEEIEDESEYVYDLEVSGTHVFCAGVGPVVVHNTDFGVSCAERGLPSFTLPVPPNNYHIWSATFGSAPEKDWGRVMRESRQKFVEKWSARLGVRFSDAPDIHNLLMDKIPKFEVRWLGLGGTERMEIL